MALWALIMRRKYVNLILSRRKRYEIRWSGTLNIDLVKPGDILLLVTSSGVEASTRVLKIWRKPLQEITLEEVRGAGFSTRSEFLRELRKLYPPLRPQEIFYILELEPLADLRTSPIPLECVYCYGVGGEVPCTLQDLKTRVVPITKILVPPELLRQLLGQS